MHPLIADYKLYLTAARTAQSASECDRYNECAEHVAALITMRLRYSTYAILMAFILGLALGIALP